MVGFVSHFVPQMRERAATSGEMPCSVDDWSCHAGVIHDARGGWEGKSGDKPGEGKRVAGDNRQLPRAP